jgi:LuxR family maltose regulon positive regulatory protein
LRFAYYCASPGGFDGIFIDFEKDMRTLTAYCMKNGGFGMPQEWLASINRASSAYARKLSYISGEFEKEQGIANRVKLSRSETKVLRAMYQGLSRTEIAADCKFSLNTVKTIIRSICDKLGTETQSAAILAAIKMNLL